MSEIVQKWLEEVQHDWKDLWIPGLLGSGGMQTFLEHALVVGDLRRLVDSQPVPEHFAAGAWGEDEPRGVWRECPATGGNWFEPDGALADYCPACGARLRTDSDPVAVLCQLARQVTGAPEGSDDPFETLADLYALAAERQKQEASASDPEENSQE